jgi:hypothetical protein
MSNNVRLGIEKRKMIVLRDVRGTKFGFVSGKSYIVRKSGKSSEKF